MILFGDIFASSGKPNGFDVTGVPLFHLRRACRAIA
jgi:hypothetical protein